MSTELNYTEDEFPPEQWDSHDEERASIGLDEATRTLPHGDVRYNCDYDCYYSVSQDRWVEEKCSDPECVFCPGRPDKPSEVNRG